jgi:hypothetical protein
MTQHAPLTPDRWSRFDREQQLLMIGNEMNRTSKLLSEGSAESRNLGYERVLRLTHSRSHCLRSDRSLTPPGLTRSAG